MSFPPIYYIKDGNLSFGPKTVLSNLTAYLYPGDKICLIGRNGCGKSSLMKVIYGEYELDNGEIFQSPAVNTAYLKQDIKTDLNSTVYNFILSQFANPDNHKYQADIILGKLELDGTMNLANCSGGQIRRAYLAKTLILNPDILLLDEPTNHLDITIIEWLEEFVKSYQGSIICISHDRAFLSNVTNKIWWLDRGVLRKSDKGFRYFDEWQELVITQEEAELRKLNKKLDLENNWLNAGVTARRKRNQKRLADLRNLREVLKKQNAHLATARQKIETELEHDIKKTKFIIEADNISFTYENKKIIDDFTFRVKKGEKIGIIGPNGSGKSTFIKILIKELQPQIGKVKHGANLEISYFDQYRIDLNPNHTLQQTLCPTGGNEVFLVDRTMHVAGYLKKFMFDPKLLNAKVSTLSGGEASRLLLAKTLINPGNLLILDEPTNDLDMDSLEILLEILASYTGTILIVSHDRDFLDRLVTRTLIFTPDKIVDMAGGYTDYKQFIGTVNKITKSPNKIKHTQTTNSNNIQKKLSYHEQRLLVTIPEEVQKLESEIKDLEDELADSNLYLTNRLKFTALSQSLSSKQQKLDALLNQWIKIGE